MLEHTIVMGILPEDATDLLNAMNKLSAEGYATVSTTMTELSPDAPAKESTEAPDDGTQTRVRKFQYAALMGKPLAKATEGRRTISMSGGGPRGSQNVDSNAASQQENPAAG